jgi:hypothetical protein
MTFNNNETTISFSHNFQEGQNRSKAEKRGPTGQKGETESSRG